MREWTLTAGADASDDSIVGFAVYDSLGVRLGHVFGYLKDPGDRIQMLLVRATAITRSPEFLVPIGAVTHVAAAKSFVQLRDLTKQSICRLCFRYTGDLPEHRLLVGLQRHFPRASPSVRNTLSGISLAGASRLDSPAWTRLSDLHVGEGL